MNEHILKTGMWPVEEVIPGINVEGLEFKNKEGKPIPYQLNNRMRPGNSCDETFAYNIREGIFTSKNMKELFRDFKDQIVVDLGAGSVGHGHLYANLGGAKGYVAVEPSNDGRLYSALVWPLTDRDKCKRSLVADDMLSFLKKLPSDSVSLFMSGIDSDILTPLYYRDVDAYWNDTGNEIARVLHPEGCYIKYSGISLEDDFGNLPLGIRVDERVQKLVSQGSGIQPVSYVKRGLAQANKGFFDFIFGR